MPNLHPLIPTIIHHPILLPPIFNQSREHRRIDHRQWMLVSISSRLLIQAQQPTEFDREAEDEFVALWVCDVGEGVHQEEHVGTEGVGDVEVPEGGVWCVYSLHQQSGGVVYYMLLTKLTPEFPTLHLASKHIPQPLLPLHHRHIMILRHLHFHPLALQPHILITFLRISVQPCSDLTKLVSAGLRVKPEDHIADQQVFHWFETSVCEDLGGFGEAAGGVGWGVVGACELPVRAAARVYGLAGEVDLELEAQGEEEEQVGDENGFYEHQFISVILQLQNSKLMSNPTDLSTYTPQLLTQLTTQKRALQSFLQLLHHRQTTLQLQNQSLISQYNHVCQLSSSLTERIKSQAQALQQEDKERQLACQNNSAKMMEAFRDWASGRDKAKQAEEGFMEKQREFMRIKEQERMMRQGVQQKRAQVAEVRRQCEREEAMLKINMDRKAELETEYNELFQLRKKLNNELQEMRGNIRVYCRIRPGPINQLPYYRVVNDCSLLLQVPKQYLKSENQLKQNQYHFQGVFDGASSQIEVFNELAQLIQSCIDGKNVCIFAYGQTGSGKTYTMEGGEGENEEGVIPRSVKFIFQEIQRAKVFGWSYSAEVSISEIYIETVKDLIDSTNSTEQPSCISVQNATQVDSLLKLARSNRRVAQTQCNSHSSRSHLIFTLRLHARRQDTVRTGTLNLIDLAGSQRTSQSKVQGDRLKQAMAINKSLTQLNTVITSIANRVSHIPYRNSRLTHLLQPYLSGESKTLMMVMISPLPENFHQSVCSLRFAETVMNCVINKK